MAQLNSSMHIAQVTIFLWLPLATYNPGVRAYCWTLRKLRYWQSYAGYLTV